MTDAKRSPEEQEQYDTDVNHGAAASAQFRRVYPEFDPSKPTNLEKMRKLVVESGENWTFDLLSRLFQEHRLEFELRPEPVEDVVPVVVDEKPKPEWWDAVADKQAIAGISRSDFKRFMRDAKFVETVQRVANGGSR